MSSKFVTRNGEARFYDVSPRHNTKGTLHVSGTRLKKEIDRIDYARQKSEILLERERRVVRQSLSDIMDVRGDVSHLITLHGGRTKSLSQKSGEDQKDGMSESTSDEITDSGSVGRSDAPSPTPSLPINPPPYVSKRLSLLAEKNNREKKRQQLSKVNAESFAQLMRSRTSVTLGPVRGRAIKGNSPTKTKKKESEPTVVVIEHDTPRKNKKAEKPESTTKVSPFELAERFAREWRERTLHMKRQRELKENSEVPNNMNGSELFKNKSLEKVPEVNNDQLHIDRVGCDESTSQREQNEAQIIRPSDQSHFDDDTTPGEDNDMASRYRKDPRTSLAKGGTKESMQGRRRGGQGVKFEDEDTKIDPGHENTVEERRRRISLGTINEAQQKSVIDESDRQRRKSVAVNARDASKPHRRYGELSEDEVEQVWDDVRKCRYLRGYDPPEMTMPTGQIDLFDFKKKGRKDGKRKEQTILE